MNAKASDLGASVVGGDIVQPADAIAASTLIIAKGSQLCTGSIVAPDLVLTAAHCIGSAKPDPAQYRAIFVLNLDHGFGGRVVGISGVERHPGWDEYRERNDIALLRLAGPLLAGYRPVELFPVTSVLYRGQVAILSGFGVTDPHQSDSGTLRKASVHITNPSLSFTEVVVDQTQGHGSCYGDSGGPAFVLGPDQRLLLWGVISQAYPNTTAAGDCRHGAMMMRINAYLDWLNGAAARLRSAPK